MDPHAGVFDTIMYPTALFAPPLFEPHPSEDRIPWSTSSLNPPNRINSLDPYQHLTWRMDGGETEGTRFFAIPRFAIGKPPKLIDIHIPDQDHISKPLQELLQVSSTILLPSSRISKLGISQHILRALEYLSSVKLKFEEKYFEMPYGSRIIIEEILTDVRQMDIQFLPLYNIEQQWMSVSRLQDLWQLGAEQWPEVLDINDLSLDYRLHDAVALVKIPKVTEDKDKIYVFKSLTQDLRYMYHELKILLTMSPHPNIVSRPLFLVSQKCRFGGKIGVCGFILEYHPGENLRDAIRKDDALLRSQESRLTAAKQITSALLHVQEDTPGFYSDLKLPNVLISSDLKGGVKVLLVDFEQRGGWFSWSPPEIYYLDYFEYLATYGPASEKQKYVNQMQSFVPGWRPRAKKMPYVDCKHGYSTSWNILSIEEQESAVVFMLGKLLWCLLEGVPNMNGMAINPESFRNGNSELVFPEFKQTPVGLRRVIRLCTSGAPEWEGQRAFLVLSNGKLYARGKTGLYGEAVGTSAETQEAATSWWKGEMQRAEEFLYARKRGTGQEAIALFSAIKQRPRLTEVLQALEDLRS